MTNRKIPAVYLMASARNGTIYVGVTSNLVRRIWEHKNGSVDSFTSKHTCTCLVHFEICADMSAAITREKQLKGGSRARKIALIEAGNLLWRDLYPEIL
jgi:predicted GIY-YIG superfamily endonuclease